MIESLNRQMELTREQKDIVARDLRPGQLLKVVAFAGTGKTTTLVEYAKARPHMRFLYVAFNKSVQKEAERKFPANVTARTSHALAFRSHGYMHRHRLVPGYKPSTVREALGLEHYEDAKYAIDTLTNYLVSKDAKVSKKHIPFDAGILYQQKRRPAPDFVRLANRLGRIMCDETDDSVGMLHDGYLKLYQLSKPCLHFDCILLDEAQDINPATSDFVLSQAKPDGKPRAASIILVGDSHQQIYSFRGARDVLQPIQSDHTLYLTRSFRFDSNVARVANMVLERFKGEKRKLVGQPLKKAAKPQWNPRQYTVIARTNAAIFDKAVQLHHRRKIGFVNGIDSYRFGIIRDVYHLYAGNGHRSSNPFIRSFGAYEALKRYAEKTEDYELFGIFKIVEKYQSKVPYFVDRIETTAVGENDAEIILTTAHKAKGLEWDHVQLAGDFPEFVRNGKIVDASSLSPDEFNLVYVAMTRTRCRLKFDRGSVMPEFIRRVRTEKQRNR